MFDSFDHITIAVQDADVAVQAYARLLGVAPTWRAIHPGLGTSSALFGLSNALIELVGPCGDGVESQGLRAWLATHGEGLQALALGTADAAGCTAELRARAVRAAPPQAGQAHGADGRQRSYRMVELSPRSTRGIPILAVERADAAVLRGQPAADAACVSALDHVVIRSADLGAAVQLYEKGLGLRLALDSVVRGIRMLFFRIGGVTIELVHDPAQSVQDAFGGAAYRVRDIHAAHSRMHAAGLDLSEVRAGAKPGTTVFTVRNGTCSVPTLIVRDPSRD
jgi:catechol 2,3-dioxygenase-like lactoylglutathione lyase family enzyme